MRGVIARVAARGAVALHRASSKAALAGAPKPRRHTVNPDLHSAGSDGAAGGRRISDPLGPGEFENCTW